jgi:hypothetical protein
MHAGSQLMFGGAVGERDARHDGGVAWIWLGEIISSSRRPCSNGSIVACTVAIARHEDEMLVDQ